MKKEVTKFIDKYLNKKVFILSNEVLTCNIHDIINNAVDFERPDGYAIIENQCLIIEHFEFDPYIHKKKSSEFRKVESDNERLQKKLFEKTNYIDETDYEYKMMKSSITVHASKNDYIHNLERCFKSHANKYKYYQDNIKSQINDLSADHMCFFIEDKTIFGSYYKESQTPFLITCTKEFIELWEKYDFVDYIFIGLDGISSKPCYCLERHSLINKKFLSINEMDIIITDSAQVISSQIFVPIDK